MMNPPQASGSPPQFPLSSPPVKLTRRAPSSSQPKQKPQNHNFPFEGPNQAGPKLMKAAATAAPDVAAAAASPAQSSPVGGQPLFGPSSPKLGHHQRGEGQLS